MKAMYRKESWDPFLSPDLDDNFASQIPHVTSHVSKCMITMKSTAYILHQGTCGCCFNGCISFLDGIFTFICGCGLLLTSSEVLKFNLVTVLRLVLSFVIPSQALIWLKFGLVHFSYKSEDTSLPLNICRPSCLPLVSRVFLSKFPF